MSALTLEGLKEILNEAAGDDDSFKPGQDILDTPFLELGFDSLALLETVALIKRKHGVAVAEIKQARYRNDTPSIRVLRALHVVQS